MRTEPAALQCAGVLDVHDQQHMRAPHTTAQQGAQGVTGSRWCVSNTMPVHGYYICSHTLGLTCPCAGVGVSLVLFGCVCLFWVV